MLNIPAAVQALYKQDGVHKNFRARFPNGELPDITNQNIVKESLVFQESLCSQEVFRFGLAEASMIQFETVGVENLYNLTIDCFIEIDTSSLTAAQISAVQADPGDGTLVLVSDSDTGYGYYQIPFGRFLVTSCPRNHGAMTHRKVTAYDQSSYWLTRTDPVERAKTPFTAPALTFGIRNFILSKLAQGGQTVLTVNNLQRELAATYSDMFAVVPAGSGSLNLQAAVLDGTPTDLPIRWTAARGYRFVDDAIFSIENASTWPDQASLADAIDAYAQAQHIQFETGDLTRRQYIEQKVEEGCAPRICFLTFPTVGPPWALLENSTPAVYPYYAGAISSTLMPVLVYPTTIVVADQTYTRPSSARDIQIFKWVKADPSITDPLEGVSVSFKKTGSGDGGSTYAGAYEPVNLVNGVLELSAEFASARRDAQGLGALKLSRLSSATPVQVSTTEYEELWWDDFTVDAIGSVAFRYTTADGVEHETTFEIGNGSSIYDMRENAVLKNMTGGSSARIGSLLQSNFKPHLASTAFCPIDLDMPAWPWLEAGDALELTAEDGTTVTSYILERTITGVQLLSDSISAKGGTIIDGGV